jgi:serine/threonine-protein kinase HipA
VKLLTAVVLNFLAGNMDAHGKNFSLLHGEGGIRFAPLYDVLCTTAFPEYSNKLAMDIGDYYDPKEIFAYQWRMLCKDIDYSFPAFKKIAKRIYLNFPIEARKEYDDMKASGWSHPACERALKIIQKNCKKMDDDLNI